MGCADIHNSRARGFTLLEALVAMALIAILAAIAIPQYSAYTIRGQRGAAKAALQQAAQYLERNYTANGCYDFDTAANACAATAALPSPYSPNGGGAITYVLSVTFPANPTVGQTYQLAAAPCGTAAAGCAVAGSNTTFTDPTCGALTLDNTGQQGVDQPGTGQGAPVFTPALVATCWQR